jgi:thiosulfate/3-mercaptopyruvate sulfurtransferase
VTLLLLLGVACDASRLDADVRTGYTPPDAYPAGEILVDADWLHEHLDDSDLRVIDLSPLQRYRDGHIPGATHLWWQDTIEIHNEVYGMLANEAARERLLREAGIAPGSLVVLYDDAGNRSAARVFWLLHAVGFDRDAVRVLNGGRQAWDAAGYPFERGATTQPDGRFAQVLDYEVLIGADDVEAALHDPNVAIVDNRSPSEREETWFGRLREGRIPGAVSIPSDDLLVEGPIPYFKEPDEMRRVFEDAGVRPEQIVIVYGLHGVNAAHTYLALRLLGYPSVRVYDGSWAQWGADPARPVEGFE